MQAALGFLPEDRDDSCPPDTGVKSVVATTALCPEGGQWAGINLYVRSAYLSRKPKCF